MSGSAWVWAARLSSVQWSACLSVCSCPIQLGLSGFSLPGLSARLGCLGSVCFRPFVSLSSNWAVWLTLSGSVRLPQLACLLHQSAGLLSGFWVRCQGWPAPSGLGCCPSAGLACLPACLLLSGLFHQLQGLRPLSGSTSLSACLGSTGLPVVWSGWVQLLGWAIGWVHCHHCLLLGCWVQQGLGSLGWVCPIGWVNNLSGFATAWVWATGPLGCPSTIAWANWSTAGLGWAGPFNWAGLSVSSVIVCRVWVGLSVIAFVWASSAVCWGLSRLSGSVCCQRLSVCLAGLSVWGWVWVACLLSVCLGWAWAGPGPGLGCLPGPLGLAVWAGLGHCWLGWAVITGCPSAGVRLLPVCLAGCLRLGLVRSTSVCLAVGLGFVRAQSSSNWVRLPGCLSCLATIGLSTMSVCCCQSAVWAQ